jgi:hypothetical protein
MWKMQEHFPTYLLHPCSRNLPYNPLTISRSPYAAPSTGSFIGNSPKRCGRDAALCWRDRSPFQQTPIKTTERRKQAASGSPFLWILSFVENRSCIFHIHHIHMAWRSKRKYLVRGYKNPHSNSRVSDTLMCSSFDKFRTNGYLLLISWFEGLTTNGLFKSCHDF